MVKYNHQSVEKKWQAYWENNQSFKADNFSEKPKFYALDMFPYPSGAGLHVGHPLGYTATDIICRKKRQQGYEVLHPMGWDAFGLPAENYAIKTGVHPSVSTHDNIKNFRRQIQSLGFSYDWNREVDTTNPQYFKWSQWIFLQLYKKGLAYEKSMDMNWCSKCKVVCANEEVERGRHERCGEMVSKKELKQWMFRITDYAERLLNDLDELPEWPDKIKVMQKHWIGKKTGINIDYFVEGIKEAITCFTTRPDTNFGATFLVLAPEQGFIKNHLNKFPNKEAVEMYIKESLAKSDIERMSEGRKKTGVFTGLYVLNRLNNKKIPLYVGDFVLANVGTGAVIGVPGHDLRDFEFAQIFAIEVERVVVSSDGDVSSIVRPEQVQEEEGKMINSEFLNGLEIMEAKERIMDYFEKKGWGKRVVNYKLRDWIFTRQRYWGEPIPLVHCEKCGVVPVPESELPLELPETPNYEPSETGESPLSKVTDWVNTTCPKCGAPAKRETSTMPNWAGSSWYWLRFMDPHNKKEFCSKKAEEFWGPVDLYVGGAEHAVLHLLYSRFWHKVFYDLGLVHTKEPFKKLVNQGLILSFAYENKDGVLIPIDEVEEKNGKFYHKEKKEEVFRIVAKMSKSLKNVVNPDEIVREYGADTLRMYEMFMGPFEQSKTWDSGAVAGMRKFLDRVWRFFQANKFDENTDKTLLPIIHKTIKIVSDHIDEFRFNTAISQLMVCFNELQKNSKMGQKEAESLVLLISPFAPHLAEEIWNKYLGHEETLVFANWPIYDESLLVENNVTYAIQINGKVRGDFQIDKETKKEVVIAHAKRIERVQKYLEAGEIVKEIFVPGKIVGFVVK
ncbi:leucine--tRNA ligase [Candidatus Gracilibacteria bacterium]|nr:leucine--tRNA ligase [Candidatus Gracilibacteria bacterium]